MAYRICMPSGFQLDAADREFWQLISRAAFANPFSPERRELDLRIAGTPETNLEKLAATVFERVGKIEKEDAANFRAYSGVDTEIMRTGFLFEVYHRFYEQLDHLIQEQSRLGENNCPVPFANELLALLAKRGFLKDEALRFFAIFYQMRRAYFFIVRGLIGQAPCMQELRRHLWNNVFTSDIRRYDRYLWNRMEDFSTLLLGETGTGKGAAAAAIGRSGFIPFDEKKNCFAESFAQNFVSMNLSQFPEALIESELFGHKKGAFTGAIEAHEGAFALCSPHGAIFLDEIGDVSVPIQIKLLQILQERTFTPVGSHDKLRFRGRVIAATNKSLDELRREKLFWDDFFYRLCSDSILIPPLRQRFQELPEEFDAMLEHLLSRMTGERAPELTPQVQKKLMACVGKDYAWPGNVRELEQAIRRILLTERYDGEKANGDLRSRLFTGIDAGSLDADTVLSLYCRLLHERHGTFEAVASRTNLDPRTVKKYLAQAPASPSQDRQ